MKLLVSPAPHIKAPVSTQGIMAVVIAALMPCVIAATWIFGLNVLLLCAISVASCVVFELLSELIAKRRLTVSDLSAVVTGLILALNLPPTASWWMVVVGSAVAILLVKQLFGGIGCNFLNPALTARAILLVSWPARMNNFVLDGVSQATPLASSGAVSSASVVPATTLDLFIGNIPGSMGEVCKIAILLGLVLLLVTRVVSWHVPLSFIASFMLFAWIFGYDPLRAVLSGGVLFGAVFMATDYVTNPMTRKGQLVFGVGCGLLVAVIRRFGTYPEGVTYAILIMNIFTPLIDRFMRPRVYGEVKNHA
ncbi:MAG: RnfABCDGE type electron transport complex subunit D [Eubacteriales bacterium]|nr:RnfABCDGE type electron transport complex subunit D [Eubacteriales bacterium]